MTWLREIAHVARKDLQEERGLLASYAGVVLLAVVRSMAPATSMSGLLEVLPLLVVLLGMIVVASVVQSDSPISVDVFWATQPLRPLSVLSAKLALSFGAVLLLGAIGQFLFLLLAGATGNEAVLLAVHAGAAFGLCLIIALVIGAVTRDVKSFVLATIGLLLGLGFAMILLLDSTRYRIDGWVLWLVQVLALATALAFLTRLYHRRTAGWKRWLEAITVTGVVFAALWWPSASSEATTVATPTSTPTFSLRLETLDRPLEGLELTLYAAVDSVPGDDKHLALTKGTFIVTLRSGEKIRLPVQTTPAVSLSDPDVRLPGMREVRAHTDPSHRRYRLAAQLLPRQRDQLEQGIAGVALEGAVSAREARVIGSLPLEPGASVRFPSGSVQLVHVQMARDLGLTVRRRSVGIAAWSLPMGFSVLDAPDYVLSNMTRGTVFRLQRISGSSGLGWGVIPAGGVMHGTVELKLPPIYPQSDPLDDAWLRDARLLILDWTPLVGYSVRATLDDASLRRLNSPAPRTFP